MRRKRTQLLSHEYNNPLPKTDSHDNGWNTVNDDIQLLNMSAVELIGRLIDKEGFGCIDFVHLDPPWSYENNGVRGNAEDQYDGLPMREIAVTFDNTYHLAKDDTYALVWCTFPHLSDWMAAWEARVQWVDRVSPDSKTWKYITGGAWGKTNGLGVGVHVRGDAELWLLYKKGSPKPLNHSQSNLILDRRVGHSEKPQEALRPLVKLCCPEGGLVLDPYAGETASMARACRATGRRYIGSEISPERHATALRRLALEEQSKLDFARYTGERW